MMAQDEVEMGRGLHGIGCEVATAGIMRADGRKIGVGTVWNGVQVHYWSK